MYLKVDNEFHHFDYTEELQIFIAGRICAMLKERRSLLPCITFLCNIQDLLSYEDSFVEKMYINENDTVIHHGQVAE